MTNVDGIYAVRMSGEDGQGFAMLVFQNGVLTGIDPLGVKFDGTYKQAEDSKAYEANVRVEVPPNGSVIQGVSVGSSGLKYNVLITLPPDFLDKAYVRVDTPLGPVNAKFLRLRTLDPNVVADV